jgi:hypothetical protein
MGHIPLSFSPVKKENETIENSQNVCQLDNKILFPVFVSADFFTKVNRFQKNGRKSYQIYC